MWRVTRFFYGLGQLSGVTAWTNLVQPINNSLKHGLGRHVAAPVTNHLPLVPRKWARNLITWLVSSVSLASRAFVQGIVFKSINGVTSVICNTSPQPTIVAVADVCLPAGESPVIRFLTMAEWLVEYVEVMLFLNWKN
jgi:hypothetical protein